MTATKTVKSSNIKIPCEVFHRVVGYYRPVKNFNGGKTEEFGDRTFFTLEPKVNRNIESINTAIQVRA